MRSSRHEVPLASTIADSFTPAHGQQYGPPNAPGTVIASEVRLLRDGLADALTRRRAVRILALASEAESVRAAVRTHTPDILLLDIGLNGSLALVREFAADAAVRVIALAVDDDDRQLVACVEAGVAGYIARDGALEDVIAAVHSVGRGETICSPRLAASLFRRLAALERERRGHHRSGLPDAEVTAVLSPREREILTLIDQGLANKEIAVRLHIGVATVKNHVHHLLEKLQVARRGQAVARVRGDSRVAGGDSMDPMEPRA